MCREGWVRSMAFCCHDMPNGQRLRHAGLELLGRFYVAASVFGVGLVPQIGRELDLVRPSKGVTVVGDCHALDEVTLVREPRAHTTADQIRKAHRRAATVIPGEVD